MALYIIYPIGVGWWGCGGVWYCGGSDFGAEIIFSSLGGGQGVVGGGGVVAQFLVQRKFSCMKMFALISPYFVGTTKM